ncbi:IS1634 family transposase [Nonomuraea sp. NPDC050153]|uniref:IS1634 family transposase n=1 Tax=Nonomuraea sp. NPDC050153 TaxID=3364359 RepID=UPI0037A09303
MGGLLGLAASNRKHFGGGLDDSGQADDAVEVGRHAGSAPIEVVDSCFLGAVWLLEGLWRQPAVASAIKKEADGRRFTTNMERVLFALVANRVIAPMSKLSAAEWAGQDVIIPNLVVMDDDQAYRAMDLLVEADTQGEVQEAVFFAVAHLLNLEVDLLFFDTTSTYFERDEEEVGEQAFRTYGKAKDHRDDLPQIVIGLAITREGIPVRVGCWLGHTNDQSVPAEVKDDMCAWALGRVITVVDRGFSSADNLAYVRRAGGHYIAGMRMRDGGALVEQALSRQGRYQQVRDNLRVKEVRLDGAGDVRFIMCHNSDQEQRDQQHREQAITRIEAELELIKAQRAWKAGRELSAKAREKAEAVHVRAECALRDHPTLKRWIRQQRNGRLVIDRAKVKAEERLDGKYLLATSDPGPTRVPPGQPSISSSRVTTDCGTREPVAGHPVSRLARVISARARR